MTFKPAHQIKILPSAFPPEDENASRFQNAGKFKYAQTNLGGYTINHCRSWQHHLPKQCVDV